MDSMVKWMQGNYCCRYQDKMFYVTEKEALLAELNLRSGDIEIHKVEPMRNRIYKLLVVENVLYAIDMKGYWIAELVLGEQNYRYYEIGCHKTDIGNEAYICVWNKKIYLFANDGPEVTVFDTVTKKVKKDKIRSWDEGKEPIFDFGFTENDGFAWLFGGAISAYVKYDLEKNKIIEVHSLPRTEQIMFACRAGKDILVLSANTVYQVNKEVVVLFTVPEKERLTKLCLTEKNIWILPGNGEHIYLYDLGAGKCEKYNEYPSDFEYDIHEGWGKYTSYCEDETAYYWVMRSNNYFLRIEKKTGEGVWIYPQYTDKEHLLKKYYFEGGRAMSEKVVPLDMYLRWIVTS